MWTQKEKQNEKLSFTGFSGRQSVPRLIKKNLSSFVLVVFNYLKSLGNNKFCFSFAKSEKNKIYLVKFQNPGKSNDPSLSLPCQHPCLHHILYYIWNCFRNKQQILNDSFFFSLDCSKSNLKQRRTSFFPPFTIIKSLMHRGKLKLTASYLSEFRWQL